MTVQYKTPGVYVEEIDAFPPSIVGVDTAVPVFIGYTQKAEKNGRNLQLQPVRIGSMVEYAAIFGHAFEPQFTVINADKVLSDAQDAVTAANTGLVNATKTNADLHDAANKATDPTEKATKTATAKADDVNVKTATATKNAADAKLRAANLAADFAISGSRYTLDLGTKLYNLYNSLRLFYANGGGNCYIVSVGNHTDDITKGGFENGLAAVRDLVGPTMLVIPEAVLLSEPDYKTVISDMLTQCQTKQDRVAILDVWGVDKLAPDITPSDFGSAMEAFRANFGAVSGTALKYGMAYAPFLKTSVIDPSEFNYTNFTEFGPNPSTTDFKPGPLTTALLKAANELYPDPAGTTPNKDAPTWWPKGTGAPVYPADMALSAKTREIGDLYIGKIQEAITMPDGPDKDAAIKKINQGLTAQIPVLNDIYAAMAAKLGILPPSPAMAGVYTRNDADRGVWNAPANVGLVSVIGPTLQISNTMQDGLNMPINGLAINAIRDFVGRGTLVWGARTLDGNSNDWRYIQVRRALIYIEQSVELALNKFVFEPNVAQTWVTVTSMIGSFLRGVWQAGGLMGASPAEAFTVQCGLGSTMTADDVLQGKMIVQIKLTMVHPAEFIVLTFQQQMQGAGG
jgi:phage tail sheath protein FI